jgi:hypothetical protein
MTEKNIIEVEKLKSRTEHSDTDSSRCVILDIMKDLGSQNDREIEKDITVATLASEGSGNAPKKSSILQAIEYKSPLLQKLQMNVISNYKENNFTIARTGKLFSDGTVNSNLTVKNNPFVTSQLVATVPLARDAARQLPRGDEAAFDWNNPMATAGFRSIVADIIGGLPKDLESLFINGDTGSVDTLFKLNNGLLILATDTHNATGDVFSQANLLKYLYDQLDPAALTNDGLTAMLPNTAFASIKSSQAARATITGDKTLGIGNPYLDNAELIRVPALAATTALIGNLGPGANIQGAIEQEIVVDLEKVGTGYNIRIYAYVDIVAMEPAKVLKVTNIAYV